MATEAKNAGLAIGLKNAVDIIPDVVDVVQFAVNEQCHEYSGECEMYKPFTDQNKAVFNIEYGGNNCDSPSGVKLSTIIKSEDQALNQLGGACKDSGAATPTSDVEQASQPLLPANSTVPSIPTPTQSDVQIQPTGSASEESGDKGTELPADEDEELADANEASDEIDEGEAPIQGDEDGDEDEDDEEENSSSRAGKFPGWRWWSQ